MPGEFRSQPVVLVGRTVRLEPIAASHARDLFAAGADDSIWRYMPRPRFRDEADCSEWIAAAAAESRDTLSITFATVLQATGRAIGSTRFMDLSPRDRSLEIGWTWIAREHQRSAVNTESKLLLLEHAFTVLGAHRVALKTDSRNSASLRAIERIGARREGVLRKHRVCWDGSVRDTVYYSILDDEWPQVRDHLHALLHPQRRPEER